MKIKVDDIITVTEKPKIWNSYFSEIDPFNLNYPEEFKVIAIKDSRDFSSPALELKCLKDNVHYGFSYNGIKDIWHITSTEIYLSNSILKYFRDVD